MDKCILSLFLLLSISGAVSAVISVNGSLGRSILFSVVLPNQPIGLITWNFGNNLIALYVTGSPPRCLSQFTGRCTIFINGSLLLDKISYNDEGMYTMNAENDAGNILKKETYQLRVYAPLSAPVLSSVTSSSLISGTYVTLWCDTGNQDVTSYTFYRDDQKIICSDRVSCRGSFLDFIPISEDDSGSHTCAIQNPVSTNTSNVLSLTVYVPVSNVAVTSNVSGLVWPGLDSVSLRCSAHGTNVSFLWSLQGAPISGGRYTLIDNNAVLTISPVSTDDSRSFMCTATNIISSQNSSDVRLNLAWFPDGDISCTAQSINQVVQLGCSWPGGKPAANVTMIFGNVQNTSSNEVYRDVSSASDIRGSSLTCNGNQLGRTSSCVLTFEAPMSPHHTNDTITPAVVEGAVNLTVDLQAGAQSRASTVSAQVLPASFFWFRGNSSSSIQNGDKFRVVSTPYTSTLTIDKLTEAESGEYICVARNFIGNTTFLFNVKVSQSGDGSSNGLDGGAIAGIVIGVLAGVALIGFITFFILKKRKTPEATYEDTDSSPAHVYETQLPGIAMNTKPIKEEAHYQELTHGNKSIYHTVMPGSGR